MIRVAYLQVGPPEHGICRYGRALAAEGRHHGDLVVIEKNITLDDKLWTDLSRLRVLGRKLSSTDLVHLQVSLWSDGSWGRGWHALANLWTFRRHCRAPLVITLHDVNSLYALDYRSVFQLSRSVVSETIRGFLRLGVRLWKQMVEGRISDNQLVVRLWDFSSAYRYALARTVSRAASLVLAITTAERDLLQETGIARNPLLIPHFVEDIFDPRPASVPGAPASIKTVIVAGFLFNSKGHPLLIKAIPLIPDVRVVFVGGQGVGAAGSENYMRVMNLVREKGVQDRVEVTGYLQDEEFQRQLSTADLAVCAFEERKSASGSLSALIAAGCPVLASDISLIAEYNALVPGAIPTFSPFTAEALAASIGRLLTMPRAQLTEGLAKLRKILSIATIYNQHVDAYQRILGNRQLGVQGTSPAAVSL